MEALAFNRSRRVKRQGGFSMIEMLFATVILSVGLLSLAGLMSKMDLNTSQTRYSNAASLLCSEKLEELSGMRPDSSAIRVVSGNSAGSLTTDKSTIINAETIAYFDSVSISAENGFIRETKENADGQYNVISQNPQGVADQEVLNSAPVAVAGTVTFKRRWLIETGVSGLPSQVRRITVRVEYPTGTNIAKFQMSMVRNAEPTE